MSRAIGETAPIITIGALTFIAFLPPSPVTAEFPFLSFEWLKAPFTVMPIQMFNWTSRPDEAFHANAAAAGTILVVHDADDERPRDLAALPAAQEHQMVNPLMEARTQATPHAHDARQRDARTRWRRRHRPRRRRR